MENNPEEWGGDQSLDSFHKNEAPDTPDLSAEGVDKGLDLTKNIESDLEDLEAEFENSKTPDDHDSKVKTHTPTKTPKRTSLTSSEEGHKKVEQLVSTGEFLSAFVEKMNLKGPVETVANEVVTIKNGNYPDAELPGNFSPEAIAVAEELDILNAKFTANQDAIKQYATKNA